MTASAFVRAFANEATDSLMSLISLLDAVIARETEFESLGRGDAMASLIALLEIISLSKSMGS